MPDPFELPYSSADLEDLRERFARTCWPDEIRGPGYWMTKTVHSSFRLYFESRKAPLHFSASDFVDVPCGIARFPKEEPFPPRPWIERGYSIEHWTDMRSGGHFAAWEEPALLAEDIRSFFRRFR